MMNEELRREQEQRRIDQARYNFKQSFCTIFDHWEAECETCVVRKLDDDGFHTTRIRDLLEVRH